MVSLCWFLTGFLIGFAAAEVVIYIVISHDNKKISNEEFVKKLIEEKGWAGAYSMLAFNYGGKYLAIWRKLYKEHIGKMKKGE